MLVDKPHVPSTLLTETELLRRLDAGQYRATKLRRAGVLVLYLPERVQELAPVSARIVRSHAATS